MLAWIKRHTEWATVYEKWDIIPLMWSGATIIAWSRNGRAEGLGTFTAIIPSRANPQAWNPDWDLQPVGRFRLATASLAIEDLAIRPVPKDPDGTAPEPSSKSYDYMSAQRTAGIRTDLPSGEAGFNE